MAYMCNAIWRNAIIKINGVTNGRRERISLKCSWFESDAILVFRRRLSGHCGTNVLGSINSSFVTIL